MSIYDHLEFRHFKYIVAIADAGTFTAAAIRLPLAQSALSRLISELEDALGVHIFDRSRGGATLTDAGESLFRFARELLQTRVEIVNEDSGDPASLTSSVQDRISRLSLNKMSHARNCSKRGDYAGSETNQLDCPIFCTSEELV
jgi:molybdenum-dependent DNA-binding transcriptional regulator ModE